MQAQKGPNEKSENRKSDMGKSIKNEMGATDLHYTAQKISHIKHILHSLSTF